MRSITGVKVNVNIEILRQIKKLTLSVFLYQEQQVWASCVLSISFFRHCQELSIFILAYQKRLKIAATGVAAVNIN